MFKLIFGTEQKASEFCYWIQDQIENIHANFYYDHEIGYYYVEIEKDYNETVNSKW